MHSLEPELRELHASGLIDDATAARAIAVESGSVFTLYQELRAALYVAVSLLVAGVGLLLKNRLARVGPLPIILTLAVVAALGYGSAIRTARQGRERTLAGDYVLLLAALVLSADLGYAEEQYQWLGAQASLHLLLLAMLHAAIAYAFDSRLLLSLSLASLVSWFGAETRVVELLGYPRGAAESGVRALACALLVLLWRVIDRRFGRRPRFQEVLEHFAVNIACWGALAWCFNGPTRWGGLVIVIAIATVSIRRGLRLGGELLVVYGVLYGAVGICATLAGATGDPLVGAVIVLLTALGAARLLLRWRRQLRGRSST
jgi:hypothetical protein